MTEVDLHITAQQEAIHAPWLCQLARQFQLEYLLIRANVDEEYGWLHLRLKGSTEEVQRAITWLMTTGMHVEAMQRSVGV